MAREIDLSKPLSDEDVTHLRSRYSDAYVDRLVAIAGAADPSGESEEAGDGDESGSETTEEANPQGDGSEGSEGEEEDDDLIGDPFDPTQHTEAEVKEYLKGVDDAEKARVLALESGREDREPRKGVLAL